MGETERLTVDTIAELQNEIATQREVICNLTAMNDELQAKVDKIEELVNSDELTSECYGCSLSTYIREVIDNGESHYKNAEGE